MFIKDQFSLLKNTPNVLSLSPGALNSITVDNYSETNRRLYAYLKLSENRVSHFTKDKTFKFIENIDIRDKYIRVVNYKDYPLPVSYNKTTGHIIINLSYFTVNDLSMIDQKDLYATIVYGICFFNLVTGKGKVKEEYSNTICNFMLTMFVRIFGKEYGLLGAYSKEILKLKFLISCYVLTSFFGASGDIYKKAHSVSGFDYKPIEDELKSFDFSDILSFIESLSKLDVFPGITRYKFSSKFLTFLGLNFIPALEDLSRFISIITISSFVGVSITPTFLRYYNKSEFDKILTISKGIF